MITTKSLPTIANVAAGNTCSITLPVGNVYETVFLNYAGITLAQIENIKVELNSRMVSEYANAAALVSIDNHYNRKQETGVLVFNFNRPELHAIGQRRFFGLDTSKGQGIQTASIKFDIHADATNPVLSANARLSQAVVGAPNYLTKVRRFIVPVSAAGTFDIDNIPRPVGASIAAIHLYKSDVTRAELLVDNVNWHEISKIDAAKIQKINGRTPQDNDSTVIDLLLDGDITQALPLTQSIQDFRLRCAAGSAGQVDVLVEYIDVWGAGRF